MAVSAFTGKVLMEPEAQETQVVAGPVVVRVPEARVRFTEAAAAGVVCS